MRRVEKNKEKTLLIEEENQVKEKARKRKKKIKFFFVFFFLISFLILSLRYLGTSGLIVREYNPSYSNLEKSFHGFKIVQFSDLHYGHTTFDNKVKEVVEKINYLKPDLIVFTGDLVDKSSKNNDLSFLTKELTKLEAKYGKYMVLGNHDQDEKIKELLIEAGFVDLNNNYDLIYNDSGDFFVLSGLASSVLKTDDPQKTFAYFEENTSFSMIILHEPDSLKKLLGLYPIDLALAGHSHNGQLRLPFMKALITPVGAKKYSEEYYYEKQAHIYISGGIGTTIVPFRSFNHPSINLIRLRSQKN